MVRRLAWFDFHTRTDSTRPRAKFTARQPAMFCSRQFTASHSSGRTSKLNKQDLKSRVPKETYRFNSGPGHQDLMGLAICRTPGWLAYDTEIANPESLS